MDNMKDILYVVIAVCGPLATIVTVMNTSKYNNDQIQELKSSIKDLRKRIDCLTDKFIAKDYCKMQHDAVSAELKLASKI